MRGNQQSGSIRIMRRGSAARLGCLLAWIPGPRLTQDPDTTCPATPGQQHYHLPPCAPPLSSSSPSPSLPLLSATPSSAEPRRRTEPLPPAAATAGCGCFLEAQLAGPRRCPCRRCEAWGTWRCPDWTDGRGRSTLADGGVGEEGERVQGQGVVRESGRN